MNKKKGSTLYIGAALTIVLLSISIACGAPPEKAAGEFEVLPLKVAPAEVNIGEEAKVTAKIVNIGEDQGVYTAVLLINDVEFGRKDVIIPAEDIGIVPFSLTKYEPGTYQLAVDGSTASLSVSDPMQTIRSSWQIFRPLADTGLVRFEILFNRNLYRTDQLSDEKYEEQRDTLLAKMKMRLDEVSNQEIGERWNAAITASMQTPPPTNVAKLSAEFSSLYWTSLDAAINDLRSNFDNKQKSIIQPELQEAWRSLEPLAEIELLLEENIRDSLLEQAEEISESEYYARTANVSEKINAALDKLGNEDFTEKLTAAWFKPWGAEKTKLWVELMDLYQNLFTRAMEDFSQKLNQ